MTIDLFDKEHYELLEQFEREYQLKPDAREQDKAWWKRGHIYSNGEINRDFQNYRRGYSFGKKLAEVRALPQPRYSHRNGESVPPTIEGQYWFKGTINRYGDPQDIADLKTVEFRNGTGIIVNEEGDDFLFEAQGQWWGPIVSPWEVQP